MIVKGLFLRGGLKRAPLVHKFRKTPGTHRVKKLHLFLVYFRIKQPFKTENLFNLVPFGTCQDPVKLLLTFFSQEFERLDVEYFFWGPRALSENWKNQKMYFFGWNTKFEILMVSGSHKKIWLNRRWFFFQRGTL